MSEFFFLGRCKEISTEKGKFKFPDGFILLSPSENLGYIVALYAEGVKIAKGSESAKKRYFEFNGKKCSKILSVPFDVKRAEYFAKGISVLYESSKKHGGGDGNMNLFRHQFGNTVHVWTNPEKTVYIMGGRNLIVSSRGIEH